MSNCQFLSSTKVECGVSESGQTWLERKVKVFITRRYSQFVSASSLNCELSNFWTKSRRRDTFRFPEGLPITFHGLSFM